MSTTKLLETLLDIERRLGRTEPSTLRNLIMDAQTQVLGIQKDSIQLLEEIQRLRELREIQLPSGQWRAVAQVLAAAEAEKDDARLSGLLVVKDRAS